MAKLRNYNKTKKIRISNRAGYSFFLLAAGLIFTADNLCFGNDEMELKKAWSCYLRGGYNEAADACRDISKDKMLGKEGHYIMALSFLGLADYQEARKNFEFVIESYPVSKKKEEALLGIADSYYLEGKFDKAEEYYTRVLENFPDANYASIVYLGLGRCQREQGKWQEAEASFYKVVNNFPLSLEVKAAEDYLKEKAGYFSVQVGAFSKKENAQRLCGLLRKKGYDVYMEKTCRNDKLVYRVRAGKFDTKEGAQEEAARLRKEGLAVKICT